MEKQLTGRKATFNSVIENFKVKGSLVTINLTADAEKIDLNQLSQISAGDVIVDLTSVQTELLDEPKEVADEK